MGLALAVTVTLTEISCGGCGGAYAINERYRREKQEKGGSWTCPYCRTWWGYSEGENARLREQVEAEKKRTRLALERENAERAERVRIETERDKIARKLKRVTKGVCPECQRSFSNLARHMHTKHGEGHHLRVGAVPLP